jgi:hypothetical protein
MTEETTTTAPEPAAGSATVGPGEPKRSRRGLWIAIGILSAVLVVGGLVGIVVWSLGQNDAPPSSAELLASYRDAWASAMKKASVEASFPAEPVDITALKAAGQHDFEATFTAEEITALVNAYRYAPSGQAVTLREVSVRFPAAGQGALSCSAVINGSGYSAELAGPAGFENGQIVPQGQISVSVEGFGVGGERARQAVEAAFGYLNEFLAAAPGLTVESAEITAEGVRVKGTAPDVLYNPEPDASAP